MKQEMDQGQRRTINVEVVLRLLAAARTPQTDLRSKRKVPGLGDALNN